MASPSTRSQRSRARPPASTTVAVEEAVQENQTVLHLPGLGDVSLPPIDHLAWYAGVATLTAIELIDWPVAVVLAVGKALADNRSHRTLRSLGEALEEAG